MKETKKLAVLTLAILMALSTILSACTSSVAEPSKKEEVAKAEQTTQVVEEVKTEEPTPEPTAEPTPEPTPEPVVYEGIDMESTLPGIEWMETFEGIIEEPVFVVYNDETNKKVIVQDGGEVELAQSDTLTVYTQKGIETMAADGKGVKKISSNYYNNVVYTIIVFEEGYEISEDIISVGLYDGETKTTIKCTIVPEEQ